MSRISVKLSVPDEVEIPTECNKLLAGVLYRILGSADEDFAREMHDDGYAVNQRRFKLFGYSKFRSTRRVVRAETTRLGPGPLNWIVTSAREDFTMRFIAGLMKTPELTLGNVRFQVDGVEFVQPPNFRSGRGKFLCLTPIVATTRKDDRNSAWYINAHNEMEDFTRVVKQNLCGKFEALYGVPHPDPHFNMQFDPGHCERHNHRCFHKTKYGEIPINGMFAPFRAVGSPELLEIGYLAGFGQNNAIGYGVVE